MFQVVGYHNFLSLALALAALLASGASEDFTSMLQCHGWVLKGGCSRGGGNWGTLRIPREDWGTLGSNRED